MSRLARTVERYSSVAAARTPSTFERWARRLCSGRQADRERRSTVGFVLEQPLVKSGLRRVMVDSQSLCNVDDKITGRIISNAVRFANRQAIHSRHVARESRDRAVQTQPFAASPIVKTSTILSVAC